MGYVQAHYLRGLFPGQPQLSSVLQVVLSLVTQKYVDLRNHFVICIDGATAGGSLRLIQLPASWKPVNALTTVAGYHEQYYMEFLKQYGVHLLCSAVAQSPFDQIRFFSQGSRAICNSPMC
jgi:hypothetical protein